jgi:hypothetical protein
LEVNIALVADFLRPGQSGTLQGELLAFLGEDSRFQAGPLPKGFERQRWPKYLVALFRTRQGDYGLITRYAEFAVVELAGQVGVAPVPPGAKVSQ